MVHTYVINDRGGSPAPFLLGLVAKTVSTLKPLQRGRQGSLGVAGGSNEGNIATTQKNLTTATCLHHCHCMSRLASKKLAPPPSTNPQELFQYHF
ncbi:hypothetical protein Y1Q_0022084 [Alligator mississippiensis]|uniref:Uncharacterized protein n=1 Tax=Alligator mississippiensis TaxID=8496 RepID=A0A151NTD5_ALLMI|nr:hypothetical protein Y1Q_0022084 [Alligator mississippiensis]